ncbi:MAG: Ig-like domain-containing protein [Acidiferrobacterales bacterium]
MTGSQDGGTINLPSLGGRAAARASVLAVAFFLSAAAQVTTPAPSTATTGVWLADHKTLKRIDPAAPGVAQSYRLERKPRALALDPNDNALWVLIHRRLLKFDAQASLVHEIDLADLTQGTTHASGESGHAEKRKHRKNRKKAKNKKKGLTEATRLVVNPFDQSLWIAGERTLAHLDPEGALLEVVEPPGRIDAIALGLDERLWVLDRRQLWQLAPGGNLTEPLNLPELIDQLKDDHADDHGHARGHGKSKRTRFMALDPVGQVLWLANPRHLARINLSDFNDAAIVYHAVNESRGAHADKRVSDDKNREQDHKDRHRKQHQHTDLSLIRDLTIDPRDGTLWLVNKEELVSFARSGNPHTTVALPDELPKPEILVFDPANPSLWLAGGRTLLHFDANGHLLGKAALEKNAEALAVTPFSVRPELSLLEPPDGVGTNNPATAIRLHLAARCNGTPCELGQAYTDALELDARLNGVPIGDLFKINAGEARYRPGLSFPDGFYEFTAQAIDAFGHVSNPISSQFTIDTVPPRFIALTPAHGSTLNTGEITIEGRVDEPAVVILTHPDGAITVGSERFAFAVTLTPGLNNFTLLARDFAGNESTVSTAITLDTVPPLAANTGLITIAPPDSGVVTVTGRGGSVEPGAEVTVTNTRTGESVTVIADSAGAFSADIAAKPGDAFTVVVKDVAGNASNAVDIATSAPTFKLHMSPSTGVAPLTVRFSLLTEFVPIDVTLDLQSDGLIEFTGPSLEGQAFTYDAPGRYLPTVAFTDAQGKESTASAVVLVEDRDALDALLQSKWAGMKAALQEGDIQRAIQFIAPRSRGAYEQMFRELAPILATVGAELGEIRIIQVREALAEYELLAVEGGESVSYYVEFIQDENEQWHLKFF